MMSYIDSNKNSKFELVISAFDQYTNTSIIVMNKLSQFNDSSNVRQHLSQN